MASLGGVDARRGRLFSLVASFPGAGEAGGGSYFGDGDGRGSGLLGGGCGGGERREGFEIGEMVCECFLGGEDFADGGGEFGLVSCFCITSVFAHSSLSLSPAKFLFFPLLSSSSSPPNPQENHILLPPSFPLPPVTGMLTSL